jgi:hypothetical protein
LPTIERRRRTIRSLLLAALGITTFAATMAVETLEANAVVYCAAGSDGYLRVFYDKLGVKFQTYDQWTSSDSHVPAGTSVEQ